MKKIILTFVAAIVCTTLSFSQVINGTYAIQNTVTGKNLRPFDAGSQNGNKIVLYDHVEWKCMTWKFTNVTGNIYQLQNLFTSKTFQPKQLPAKAGVTLEQQPVSKSSDQNWEFIRDSDNSYFIRLKGTELYITASSSQTNTDILLKEKQAKELQLWRLVAQNPKM
jgi:hypothetical protein